jgi:hypothetical protein
MLTQIVLYLLVSFAVFCYFVFAWKMMYFRANDSHGMIIIVIGFIAGCISLVGHAHMAVSEASSPIHVWISLVLIAVGTTAGGYIGSRMRKHRERCKKARQSANPWHYY